MSKAPIPTLVAAGVGGLAGALAMAALGLLTADAAREAPRALPRSASAAVVDPSATDAELGASLAALEERHAALSARLASLERARSAQPVVAPAAEVPAEALPGPQELAAAAPGEPLPPAFVDGVYAALRDIRETEELERQARWQTFREERIEERLERLREELGLTPHQTDEMRELLLWREARRDELRRNEAGLDRDLVREDMRILGEETDRRLAGVLLPDQLARYEEAERARESRDRGWNRRPAGPGPPEGAPPDEARRRRPQRSDR